MYKYIYIYSHEYPINIFFCRGGLIPTCLRKGHMFQLVGDAQLRIVLCQAGKVHHLQDPTEFVAPKTAPKPVLIP